MAEAILYGLAQEILKNMGSTAVQEMASAWGFKSPLHELQLTFNIINDFLLDAEDKQADSHAVRTWLQQLTDVVYNADDLFDEFATVAARKQLMGGTKMTKEVRTFFSSSNQMAFAFSISKKIQEIREELVEILKVGNDLQLVSRAYEEGRVITKRRDQSYSFVDAEDIIGRDADKKAILDLLLASSSREQKELPVISIVGMGGLGKTALAQLIYNDPLVEEFFELRLWVCVSDVFDIKEITANILMSATNSEAQYLEMEQLQARLRKEIADKKYLIVLDDVWNENREEWLKLRALLQIGRTGSKILVTTRSSKVAKIMCTLPPYKLSGLSDEKSWNLFDKVAFEQGQTQQMPHIVDIGKEIVQKCANVPLAIRALGSVLYGEDESKWLSFKDKTLAKISNSENDIMNILKLSYHHLRSPLKNCFAYCALYPKDFIFYKEMLIDLWMAEGFIVPTADESQSLEELSEEYFLTLLQRGFFQDVKMDKWGRIKSCKIHDFMHDLALEVAGAKCKAMKHDEIHNQDNIRHLSLAYRLNFQRTIPSMMLNSKLPRTLLLPQQRSDGSTFNESICRQIISSFGCLRVLDLHDIGLRSLPTSIGKLIHLRYLDLSCNPLITLPDSITKLHNLQTLNLKCSKLETIPEKITKLVNLRSFVVSYGLLHMPSGIGELSLLHKLPLVIIGSKESTKPMNKPNRFAQLSDLKKLNNLRGNLWIIIYDSFKTKMENREQTLTCKHGLTELVINFEWRYPPCMSDRDEVALEHLKPHPNLRKLFIQCYKSQKLPSWAMKDSFLHCLPNLVEIDLSQFEFCQEIPDFSQLPLLKRLSLRWLPRVEYIQMENGLDDQSSSIKSPLFFPNLETLELSMMKNLKGWWKLSPLSLSFPKLSNLTIINCPHLTSFPNCPNVEKLKLVGNNKELSVMKMATTSSKLKELSVDNVEDFISMPTQCLLQLSSLEIQGDSKLDNLGQVFATISSSLRSLTFWDCGSLESRPQGLEHLTSLEEFTLYRTWWHFEDGDEEPWKSFKTSLRTLGLRWCPNLRRLPGGFQHLENLRNLELTGNDDLTELPKWMSCFSSLEFLKLVYCPKLTSLPEGFCMLTSLQELNIYRCEGLTERCRGPNGSDWPKIQHIPLVIIEEYL